MHNVKELIITVCNTFSKDVIRRTESIAYVTPPKVPTRRSCFTPPPPPFEHRRLPYRKFLNPYTLI